jgi:CRISPR-associated protein Csh2
MYEGYAYGTFMLKSKNSLFNADFSHEPRQLPDENGTFYATDKSLKYCIRRYVHDVKGDKMVFFWRRSEDDKELKPLNLTGNYKYVFGVEPKKKGNAEAEEKLLTCWDVRAFGATFAEEGCNLSITGPIQISYGVNKTPQQNQKYSSQILSPFQNAKTKDAKQRTMGSESKALEAHLAFDFLINPNTLREKKLTEDDVSIFKEALCKGVSHVNSAAKIGSESEFMLFIESKEHTTMPLLKDYIDVSIKDGKTIVDLSRLSILLKEYENVEVEVYYEPTALEVADAPGKTKHFNIHILKEIKPATGDKK